MPKMSKLVATTVRGRDSQRNVLLFFAAIEEKTRLVPKYHQFLLVGNGFEECRVLYGCLPNISMKEVHDMAKGNPLNGTRYTSGHNNCQHWVLRFFDGLKEKHACVDNFEIFEWADIAFHASKSIDVVYPRMGQFTSWVHRGVGALGVGLGSSSAVAGSTSAPGLSSAACSGGSSTAVAGGVSSAVHEIRSACQQNPSTHRLLDVDVECNCVTCIDIALFKVTRLLQLKPLTSSSHRR